MKCHTYFHRIEASCHIVEIECQPGRNEEILKTREQLDRTGFREAENVTVPKWERDSWSPVREISKYLAPENEIVLLKYNEYSNVKITETGSWSGTQTARKVVIFVRNRVLMYDTRPIPFVVEAYEQTIERTLKVGAWSLPSVKQQNYSDALEIAMVAERLGLTLRENLSVAKLRSVLDDPSHKDAVERQYKEEDRIMDAAQEADHQLCISNYNEWKRQNK